MTTGHETSRLKDQQSIRPVSYIKDQLSGDQLSEDKLSKDQLSEDQFSKDQISKDQLSEEQLSEDQLSEDQLAEDQLSLYRSFFVFSMMFSVSPTRKKVGINPQRNQDFEVNQ